MADGHVPPERGTEAAPTHTTIIHETRSSGGTGIIMALILLVAIVGGVYLFAQSRQSETVRDNAVAEAAKDVGNAATKVGDAAEDAVSETK